VIQNNALVERLHGIPLPTFIQDLFREQDIINVEGAVVRKGADKIILRWIFFFKKCGMAV